MASEILAALLRANLAIAAAILLVLVLRRPMRAMFGARAAYGLWLIAPLAVLAVLAPARVVSIAAPAPSIVASTPPTPTPSPEPRPMPTPGVETTSLSSVANSHGLRDALVITWALVALLALCLQAERQRRFLKSLGRLRGEADLFHAEHAGVGPAVIGALSPRVVLPSDFALRFTPEEQALILAHERNHLSTGDAQINALTTAIQCLFWFNPLVHLGANRLRVDQEIACDAAVLTRYPVARRTYGEAMLKTQLAPHAPPLGCHWPASANKQLKERFVMLKHHRLGRARRIAGAASVAVLALGAGFTAWAAQPAREIQQTPELAARAVARHLGRPLFDSVRQGDAQAVRELLAAGANPDTQVVGDGTPLIEAARQGRIDLVELLLSKGANPNLGSRGDGNPLIMAAARGRLDIVKALVEHGASVESFVPGDETPLINAAQSGDLATVRYLVEKGADVNRSVIANPGETRSPLSQATRRGHFAVVRYLKTKGARA